MPTNVNAGSLQVLDAVFQGGFRKACAEARMRYRTEPNGQISWRALSRPVLFHAVPLQTAGGQFRAAARARLQDDLHGDDIGPTNELEQSIVESGVESSPWADVQRELVSAHDPVPVLEHFRETVAGELVFYRLKATSTLWWRSAIWQAVTEVAKGTSARAIAEAIGGRRNTAVSGMVELAPASVICGPLLARQQPLAAVFMTGQGAQVVVLARTNAFNRPIHITSWPIGMYRVIFAGPGHQTHATDVSGFASGHAERMFSACIDGANRLVHYLTDPAAWVETASGALDLDGRWMTWSSVLFGLDAIASLGAVWSGADPFWVAFRALGVLQGLWNGNDIDRIGLDQLLDPRLVRSHALPVLPAGQERTWASGLINNYERDIRTAFGGQSLDDALKTIVQVRNLVHGVRGRKGSTARLEALRHIERSTPNLQLINEICVFWWTAALLSPGTHCRVGHAPWEQ